MANRITRDIAAEPHPLNPLNGGTRYGLVIGIEKYQQASLNLNFAAADAKAVYELMVDPGCGGFQPENVVCLLDADATEPAILGQLRDIRSKTSENDTVWIYYAGHAAVQRLQAYWVTHFTDVKRLQQTALPCDLIKVAIESITAKRVLLLLDCCHGAATVRKNHAKSIVSPKELFDQPQGEGLITIASSDGTQKSIELSDKGHGAFTYFLLRGLRGEADGGDGIVTVNELCSYLNKTVPEASRRAGSRQTPVALGALSAEWPLTVVSSDWRPSPLPSPPPAPKHTWHVLGAGSAAVLGLFAVTKYTETLQEVPTSAASTTIADAAPMRSGAVSTTGAALTEPRPLRYGLATLTESSTVATWNRPASSSAVQLSPSAAPEFPGLHFRPPLPKRVCLFGVPSDSADERNRAACTTPPEEHRQSQVWTAPESRIRCTCGSWTFSQ